MHLLPIYDEYIVAYRDRVAVPHGSPALRPLAQEERFQHALIVGGQIAGTWKIVRKGATLAAQLIPLRTLTTVEQRGAARAAARFHGFIQPGMAS